MFNPSTGGDGEKRDKDGKLKADKTINIILKAVDNEWFDDDEDEVTGVHIRNLFSYRTSQPSVLIEAFKRKKMELQAANNIDWQQGALRHLGCCLDGQLREWLQDNMFDNMFEEKCKYVIVGWGDCGNTLFQGVKDQVKN